MSNKEMAAVLFNIATVLRNQGNQNPFRTTAYERGARALMGLEGEAAEILEAEEKVPFRRRQRIGKKLQAKIREMAKTGSLEQYTQMVADLPPHIAGLMAVPGIGPRTAEHIYRALGIGAAADLVRAARDGRLRAVWGFGPKRTAAIAALDLPEEDEGQISALPQISLFDPGLHGSCGLVC
jgi:DNA polymerase (family 10)